MQFPQLPDDEIERLNELYRYEVLNTQSEVDFDEIVKLASEICQVPISTITLIDAYRQWHKAKVGIDSQESDRNITFCAHTILQNELMEVPDTHVDERFFDNPLVIADPNIRFYAGVPMVSSNGYNIGTLCVIDKVPRKLTDEQCFTLKVLAKQVIKLFELRLRNKEIEEQNATIGLQKLQLSELSTIQNKIISILSHDIRGPITSLKCILSLIREGILPKEEASALMHQTEDQIDQTLNLLTNLVEWGALLRNAKDITPQPIPLANLVQAEVSVMQYLVQSKQNTMQILVPSDMIVFSDPNVLKFIIRNLVSNANKFTQAGQITVVAETIDSKIRISFSDTGIGMSEEVRNNLFNPGKRSSRPGTHNEFGSGLGLLLCYEFLQRTGTELTVKSEEGKGTCISFSVPVYPKINDN